jgi:hypothetical protein
MVNKVQGNSLIVLQIVTYYCQKTSDFIQNAVSVPLMRWSRKVLNATLTLLIVTVGVMGGNCMQ